MVQTNQQNNPVRLHAGELSAIFENGMLRSVCIGSIELVRRIYPALRDHNWNTIHYRIDSQQYHEEEGSFSLVSSLLYLQNGINYSAEITVTGTADNTIELRFCGTAHSGFLRNRIGLCLLHPLDLCKNIPCEITHSDGTISHLHFPGEALFPHQPFLDVCAMSFPCGSAGMCFISFTGDTFETEDQRNWTDGSFKSYSTPLSLPVPHQVTTGDRVEQRITIRFIAEKSHPQHEICTPAPRLTLDIEQLAELASEPLRIGLGSAHVSNISPGAAHAIVACAPRHVRLTVDTANDLNDEYFANIAALLKTAGCPAELAVFYSGDFTGELANVNTLIARHKIPCERIFVLSKAVTVTPPPLLQAATSLFAAHLPTTRIYGGTDNYFVEVNRVPVVASIHNGICFAANPQVHTFDNCAIIENLDGLAECTRYAAASAQKRPVALSPLTMRPRKNPLKPQKAGGADERQQQLFAAAWLTGAIAACVKSGVASLTCFNELTGSEGIMDTQGEQLFPVYHVLASGIMTASSISAAIHHRTTPFCAVLYFTTDTAKKMLVANLTCELQTISLGNIPENATLAQLDNSTLPIAQKNCGFWQETQTVLVSETLSLDAYAVALLSF